MRIRWARPALYDLTRICDHSEVSFGRFRAHRTALEIHEAINTLAKFPRLGRPGRKPGTSELVLRGLPFVVIYRVKDDDVEIIRILHGAQKWP